LGKFMCAGQSDDSGADDGDSLCHFPIVPSSTKTIRTVVSLSTSQPAGHQAMAGTVDLAVIREGAGGGSFR
ncbi:MAG TPA: hypothetical protein H9751_00005, partial [Candidatus Corynebacterium faecigallinarum]|nr:hypothetical protein [Candidatus Corynebacterium faecigallinarum]